MARTVSESVLRAMVSRARGDDGAPRVVAVRASPNWTGETVLETDDGPVRIAPCVSTLAVRDILTHWEREEDEEVLVILTDRDEDELGQETLARVWRHRVLRPSRWEAAKSLFRVDQLDPALADMKWLVDILVEVAPRRGYPPPPSGFLDLGTAWRSFLRHGLRLDVETPSLQDVLRWGETDDARVAIRRLTEEQLDHVGQRLEADVGPAAPHVLRIVSESQGRELVPLGLVADVLWSSGQEDELAVRTARVRFENPVGSRNLSHRGAREWGEAATGLVKQSLARGEEAPVERWLGDAQDLLSELDALDLTAVSDVLPWAFMQRMIRAGQHLKKALTDPDTEHLEASEDAIALVERHLRATQGDEGDRVRRLRMAIRLLRRSRGEPFEPGEDLNELVEGFVSDGAWVDAAREAIGHGETVSSLADAYATLIKRIDPEREERDRAFAAAFASWSEVEPTDTSRLLPVERVLEEVVAPVARRAPVLLLVLDGLSYPESIRLFGDLRNAGWREQGPGGRRLPTVLSAVPSVTAVSRASLLTGRLADGGQDIERSGFQGHAKLVDAAGGRAPRLFHKKDLKTEQARIAPDVRDAVLEPEERIIGVVVNAVDDHLDKGSQLRLAEGLRALRPLRPLLDGAAEAGRAVVIASDHGHVLEHGSEARVKAGASERWRLADEPPEVGEVKISGPRVLRGGGTIVAPAVESIRYMAAEKRGYHGGVTPQEVVCPVTVVTTGGVALEGWEPIPVPMPAWWEKRSEPVAPSPRPSVELPEPRVEPSGQGVLFTEEGRAPQPDVAAGGWIAELLESPLFAEQREAAGRQALDDESVATFLTVLDRSGGVAAPAVMADVTDLPPSRVRTKLEALRRMLNLDGYPVLKIEADGTARLNLELLATQFEVEL